MEQILGFADHQRSRLLKIFLTVPTLRRIFQTRAWRLGATFAVALLLATAFSLYFLPLALLLAPLLYGAAHLWASFRYVPYAINRRFLRAGAALALTGTLLALGLLVRGFDISLAGPAALAFFVIAWMCLARAAWWKFVLLAPLAPVYFLHPLATAATVVFAHNFVAYLYWWQAARTPAERVTVLAALSGLLSVSAFIFAGAFDHALLLFSSNLEFPRELWNAADEVSRLFGRETGLMNSLHWLAAFSIAQTLHYFVWLKAIPEQHLASENPTSFARSFAKLREDYGTVWMAMILASVVLFAAFALFNFATARVTYAYISAAHAFWELAALPLLLRRG